MAYNVDSHIPSMIPIVKVPEKDKTESKETLPAILHDFCSNTTAHGLPSIARSTSKHNRLFWAICFIGFLGATIYFIVDSIRAYFDYETKMDINYDKEWPQSFAAISVCTLSRFRLDLFGEPFHNFTVTKGYVDSNGARNTSKSNEELTYEFVVDILNRNESLVPYTFPLASILKSCDFNGMACTAANFTSFFSFQYGHCFTFNSKRKSIPNGGVRESGENGGIGVLSLEFYVHSHMYLPGASFGAGILLLVHDNEAVPLIEAVGLELSTGRRHKLSYTKRKTNLVSTPKKECLETIPRAAEALMATYEDADYGYSDIPCYMSCEQSFSYDSCGCVNPKFWNVRTIQSVKKNQTIMAPVCNVDDPCPNNARDILYKSVPLMDLYCSCTQPCVMIDFMLRQSSSRAPLDSSIDEIKAFVTSSGVPPPNDWSTEYGRHIENNYLSVAVLRETNTVEFYTQTVVLKPVDVLSNVGGQTGLWIGISFFSIMELVEMIYRLIRHQCHRLRAML